MTLGEKLVQARTALGLTQTEVAGTQITRNMLSRLEHDAAAPSMKTLEYLSQVLQVPVSWLLGEPPATDTDALQEARALFRAKQYADCLTALQRTTALTTDEGLLLQIRALLQLAQGALQTGRYADARRHALQAGEAVTDCLYATAEETARIRLVLTRCDLAEGLDSADSLQQLRQSCKELGLEEGRRLLQARYYLSVHNTQQAERELWAMSELSAAAKGEYLLLRGKTELQKTRSREAMLYLLQAEQETLTTALLEQCSTEQEDYKAAYTYAAKRLALRGSR